jgi:hypothetical protein
MIFPIASCVEDQVDICIEQARKAAHAQAANISWREKKTLPACLPLKIVLC